MFHGMFPYDPALIAIPQWTNAPVLPGRRKLKGRRARSGPDLRLDAVLRRALEHRGRIDHLYRDPTCGRGFQRTRVYGGCANVAVVGVHQGAVDSASGSVGHHAGWTGARIGLADFEAVGDVGAIAYIQRGRRSHGRCGARSAGWRLAEGRLADKQGSRRDKRRDTYGTGCHFFSSLRMLLWLWRSSPVRALAEAVGALVLAWVFLPPTKMMVLSLPLFDVLLVEAVLAETRTVACGLPDF